MIADIPTNPSEHITPLSVSVAESSPPSSKSSTAQGLLVDPSSSPPSKSSTEKEIPVAVSSIPLNSSTVHSLHIASSSSEPCTQTLPSKVLTDASSSSSKSSTAECILVHPSYSPQSKSSTEDDISVAKPSTSLKSSIGGGLLVAASPSKSLTQTLPFKLLTWESLLEDDSSSPLKSSKAEMPKCIDDMKTLTAYDLKEFSVYELRTITKITHISGYKDTEGFTQTGKPKRTRLTKDELVKKIGDYIRERNEFTTQFVKKK